MTPEERQRVLDALPSELEISEASPPEGDFHFNPKVAAKETLSGYFYLEDVLACPCGGRRRLVAYILAKLGP